MPINSPMAHIDLRTPGIHHIGLRTTNLERAKTFYLETLGFQLIMEQPGFFMFRAGNSAFGIRGADEQTPKGDVFNPFRVGLDHVAIACEERAELDRVAAALSDAGIENTGIKESPPGSKPYIAFWDPDRIKWELYMV